MANVIVLFEVTLKEGHSDAYLAAAAALKQELVQTDGFLGAERFTSLASPGKLLSKSEWRDEQSVAKWRNTLRHRMAPFRDALLVAPFGFAEQFSGGGKAREAFRA